MLAPGLAFNNGCHRQPAGLITAITSSGLLWLPHGCPFSGHAIATSLSGYDYGHAECSFSLLWLQHGCHCPFAGHTTIKKNRQDMTADMQMYLQPPLASPHASLPICRMPQPTLPQLNHERDSILSGKPRPSPNPTYEWHTTDSQSLMVKDGKLPAGSALASWNLVIASATHQTTMITRSTILSFPLCFKNRLNWIQDSGL